MKYYALKYKYLHSTSQKGNLGDNIQTISLVDALNDLGIDSRDIGYVNRDDLALKSNNREFGIFIAQGWFGCMHGQQTFPINDEDLYPLYFGFHVNEGSWHFLSQNIDFINSMRKYEPIGCRDYATRDFLRELGVRAYFSGCLTLSFPERSNIPVDGKVFVIDPFSNVEPYIPEEMRTKIEYLSQENYSSNGYSPSGKWPMTDEDVDIVHQEACKRLEYIKNKADLVITGRIHVAMPCLALGIPVIFCHNRKMDSRISVLKDILPIYGDSDLDDIDWNPVLPSLEKNKKNMRRMLACRIQQIEHELGGSTRRLSNKDYDESLRMIDDACDMHEETVQYQKNSFEKKDVLNAAFGKKANEVMSGDRALVLFGAGSAGSHLCSVLKYAGATPSCFCDNSLAGDERGECQGLEVISFDKMLQHHKDSWILITVKYSKNNIYQQLIDSNYSVQRVMMSDHLIENYIDFVVPS